MTNEADSPNTDSCAPLITMLSNCVTLSNNSLACSASYRLLRLPDSNYLLRRIIIVKFFIVFVLLDGSEVCNGGCNERSVELEEKICYNQGKFADLGL